MKLPKMDCRCPRQLTDMPEDWCPQAVMRLRAIRHFEGELTEEAEASLRGCPWAVQNQMASYCFFKYMALYGSDTTKQLSDVEIAHLLGGIPVEDIKKAEKQGLIKLKQADYVTELKEMYNGEQILEDKDWDVEYDMPNVT